MKKRIILALKLGINMLLLFGFISPQLYVDAQTTGYEITGKVINASGNPIPDVQVSNGSVTVLTDIEGNYTIQGLSAGRYTILASLANYSFVSSNPMPIEVPRDKRVDFIGTALFHTVSGRITDGFGRGLSNVGIIVDNQLKAKTNVYGYYEVGGLTAGSHTIAPQLAQYTFSPASKTVTLPLNGVLINFQAISAITYSLDGTIVRSNNPEIGVMGVKISVGDLYQTISDGEGRFHLRGITPGNYEVKAELNGYQFNLPKPAMLGFPPSHSLPLIAAPAMNTIRGRVVEVGNEQPVPGVVFKVGCGHAAVSNAAGYYYLTGLPDGVFTIEPSLENYSFTPKQAAISLPMDGEINFTAEPLNTQGRSISGYIKIKGEDEEPLAGVEISNGSRKSISNINGYYKIPNLPSGAYEIKPSYKGFSFTPTSKIITAPFDEEVNFKAESIEYTIRGKVTNSAESPIQGVVIRAGVGFRAVTNANGFYLIGGLPSAASPYTLTAGLDGSIFTPNQPMPVTVPPSISDLNFTSSTSSLYGQIDGYVLYANGQPLAGATVTAKPLKTGNDFDPSPSCCCPEGGRVYLAYTDVNGYYALGGLPSGEYVVNVLKSGHSFEPSVPMPVLAPQSGVNFQADIEPNSYAISGMITDLSSMTGLSGALVYLKEMTDYSAMTNRNGYYVIGGIPMGNYSPQAALFGYTFKSLVQLPLNLSGNTQPPRQVNFEGSSMLISTAPRFSIQGKIMNGLGVGIPFVNVGINPVQQNTEKTDANGNYSYQWLDSSQTYTLTPQKSGCTFTPSTKVYQFTPPGFPEEQNFTAECSHTLNLWVKDKDGTGINGVKVIAKPLPSDAVRAEVEAVVGGSVGEYVFTALKDGMYVVQPSREGYSFIPPSFMIDIPKDVALPTFIGYATNTVYTIGGKIVNMQGEPLAGITVTDDGGNSAITNGEGYFLIKFSIESLTPGTNFIKITPLSGEYVFTPAAREIDIRPLRGRVTLYPERPDIENQNFVGRKR